MGGSEHVHEFLVKPRVDGDIAWFIPRSDIRIRRSIVRTMAHCTSVGLSQFQCDRRGQHFEIVLMNIVSDRRFLNG